MRGDTQGEVGRGRDFAFLPFSLAFYTRIRQGGSYRHLAPQEKRLCWGGVGSALFSRSAHHPATPRRRGGCVRTRHAPCGAQAKHLVTSLLHYSATRRTPVNTCELPLNPLEKASICGNACEGLSRLPRFTWLSTGIFLCAVGASLLKSVREARDRHSTEANSI